MANEATLKDIMEKALAHADYPTIDKIDPVLRENMADWANEGLAELHDLMVAADMTADYYKRVQTIPLVAGTEEYALPTDFYKLKKVFFTTDATRRYRIERFDLNNIDGYKIGPLTSGNIEVWYVPMFKPLKRDIDVVDQLIPPTWEHMAVFTVAAHLLQREQSDTTAMETDKRNLVARIMAMAEPRDEGEADAIADVSNRWSPLVRSLWAYEYRYKYRLLGSKISFVDVRFLGI